LLCNGNAAIREESLICVKVRFLQALAGESYFSGSLGLDADAQGARRICQSVGTAEGVAETSGDIRLQLEIIVSGGARNEGSDFADQIDYRTWVILG
jgi:hypothetical protein